jgi:hypothetical protein
VTQAPEAVFSLDDPSTPATAAHRPPPSLFERARVREDSGRSMHLRTSMMLKDLEHGFIDQADHREASTSDLDQDRSLPTGLGDAALRSQQGVCAPWLQTHYAPKDITSSALGRTLNLRRCTLVPTAVSHTLKLIECVRRSSSHSHNTVSLGHHQLSQRSFLSLTSLTRCAQGPATA